MPELKLENKVKGLLNDFVASLDNLYKDDLISVILYGSAASGEFVNRHSDLNVLVVLKDVGLESLKSSSKLINKWKFRTIRPLFFSQDYINSSSDVFPIEFLDMKENYLVLTGNDVLKDIRIDTKNLRFQCEQELKIKLISLRHAFLRNLRDKAMLRVLLFKSFNSIMHILRNVLRIKGKLPPYLKQDILREVALNFQINQEVWEKILAAKNKQVKLNAAEIELLFIGFIKDLDRIANLVDKL